MQLSRLRPLNLTSFIFLQIRRSLRLSVCAFYIRVEALYTLKHHPAESVTSDFFIADPNYIHYSDILQMYSIYIIAGVVCFTLMLFGLCLVFVAMIRQVKQ